MLQFYIIISKFINWVPPVKYANAVKSVTLMFQVKVAIAMMLMIMEIYPIQAYNKIIYNLNISFFFIQ